MVSSVLRSDLCEQPTGAGHTKTTPRQFLGLCRQGDLLVVEQKDGSKTVGHYQWHTKRSVTIAVQNKNYAFKFTELSGIAFADIPRD